MNSGLIESAEKTARSIFVGNIPYEATEEKLTEIFEKAGPVSNFRIVYDRESGKPKGYGFCEYENTAIAASALRNLQSIEFNGRPLRIGPAAGEQNSAEMALSNTQMGPPQESPYGDTVDPNAAPEAISRAVASLPPEQMYELMKQMKQCIHNNPNEARNMLLQNPQLAYALLQAQIVMKIVEPKVAIAMLNRSHDQIPPIQPSANPAPEPARPVGPPSMAGPYPHGSPRGPPPHSIHRPMYAPPPSQAISPRRPPPMRPQNISASTAAAVVASMGPNSMLAGQGEQEKVNLIMQVLQLSDEQVARLPEDQRRSIQTLKEQVQNSAAFQQYA
ncbi:Cleavage stimulation factor subunit 2 [Cichlidogyrus casuarinus]|uniref:Cleavage stimulation factor subunit 2 n=1 Tax=Cichlidogyrus casuarinus TaxID=1844966 RepID=A0ABD2QP67_9PLAT